MGLALLFVCTFGQAQTKIRILSADVTDIVKQEDGSRKYYLRGNVGLQQDVAVMTCDSAILIQPQNEFQAFNNVRIVQADTTIITGNKLDYNGDDRTFVVSEQVQLTTPNARLQTTSLAYDRNAAIAYYTTRSILTRKSLELTSDRGLYNTKKESVRLRGNVVAIDTAYSLITDTLHFYPGTNSYEFEGPSTLVKDSTTIRCRKGEYAADEGQLNLGSKASISSPGNFIKADSISYNLKVESGKLFTNALVADSVQGLVLEASFIDYTKSPNYVDAHTPVYYRQNMDGDTLYARGDTLHLRSDSLEQRTIDLFGSTLFFSEKFQGNSDRFHYEESGERLTLYPRPLLWSEKNQFQADSAVLTLIEERLDSLFLIGNTAIVSITEDSSYYDQATGKNLRGRFIENALSSLRLEGNAQNITHSFSNQDGVEGLNKTECAWMSLYFIEGELDKVKASKGVVAKYIPWSSSTNEDRTLPGCKATFEQRTTKALTRPIP